MSWCASLLLCRATEAATRIVATDHLLRPWAYHINDLSDHHWNDESIRHGLPEGGLLCIQPISGSQDDMSNLFENYLSWDSLHGETDLPGHMLPAVIAKKHGACEADLPPSSYLAYVQELQGRLATPVMHYGCDMHGGTVITEFAWIFDRDPGVLLHVPVLGFGQTPGVHTELWHESGLQKQDHCEMLMLALERLGIHIPTGYFAPFSADFDWDKYRL